jgi:hypothetical protein
MRRQAGSVAHVTGGQTITANTGYVASMTFEVFEPATAAENTMGVLAAV